MSDISTKSGVFETGEKDEFGVGYKDCRIVGCYNKQLTEYIVKEGTEVICDRAFMNAKDLKSVTLPASVKAIGESAFAGCKALEDINIPDGVTEIRQSTFRDCRSLGCLELPASCVKIEKWAFSDGLETLVCNAPSMQIDRSAFFSCKTLKTVMVPEGSAVDYAQAFVNCRLTPDIEEMPAAGSNETQSECLTSNIISTMKKNQNLKPQKGKAGYMDLHGNWVIKPEFDEAYRFSEGMARVKVDNKYGFIDKTGKVVIEFKYDDAEDFYGGLACVKVDGKDVFIDKFGNIVIEPKFGKQNGFIDANGDIKVEPRYDEFGGFHEGLAWVKLDEKYGYINQDGEEVIKLTYDDAGDFREGLAVVKINGKKGFINKAGEIVIQPEYDSARNFREGFAGVKLDGKWGYIKSDGTYLVEPKFDNADDFQEGFAGVELDGKWGYIDKTGEIIIEPRFIFVHSFKNGFAVVYSREEKYGVIDQEGNFTIEPKFSDLTIISENIVMAGNNGIQGLLSMDGKWILPPRYNLSYPSEGLIAAKIADWGLANEEGEWVVEPSYDYISKFYPIGRNGQRLASAKKDGKWTWLDDEGKECPDAVVDYDKASREGRKSVPAEANGLEWVVDALDEDDYPIAAMSAFNQGDLNIEIDGNYLVVDEMNSIEREDDFYGNQFCESVGAVKGILYYNKASAESFDEILVPKGEEFDPEKACLVTQEWETRADDAIMVTALIYDGVQYGICPGDSVGKGSVTIFGEDDSDYGYGYEEDEEW